MKQLRIIFILCFMLTVGNQDVLSRPIVNLCEVNESSLISEHQYVKFSHKNVDFTIPIESYVLENLPLEVIDRLPISYVGSVEDYYWIGYEKTSQFGLFKHRLKNDALIKKGLFIEIFRTNQSIYVVENLIGEDLSILYEIENSGALKNLYEFDGYVSGVHSDQWVNWGNLTDTDNIYYIVGHKGWGFSFEKGKLEPLKCL